MDKDGECNLLSQEAEEDEQSENDRMKWERGRKREEKKRFEFHKQGWINRCSLVCKQFSDLVQFLIFSLTYISLSLSLLLRKREIATERKWSNRGSGERIKKTISKTNNFGFLVTPGTTNSFNLSFSLLKEWRKRERKKRERGRRKEKFPFSPRYQRKFGTKADHFHVLPWIK